MNALVPQVFGDKDADGFFVGEISGRRGLVPGNMVSEVQIDDPEVAMQLLRENCEHTLSSRSIGSSRASSRISDVTPRTALSTNSTQGW